MGLNAPFVDGEFNKIVKEDKPLPITDIKHKATISVNADSVSASASTVIETVEFSADFLRPQSKMIINKPFLFFIRDKQEKIVLFAGKMANPEPYEEPDLFDSVEEAEEYCSEDIFSYDCTVWCKKYDNKWCNELLEKYCLMEDYIEYEECQEWCDKSNHEKCEDIE